MHTTKIANRNERRPQIARRCADQQARARRALYLVALLAGACAQTLFSSSLYAQSKSQLTIGKTTELESIDNQTISSVVFTGPYALTLKNGQDLKPVFISREAGAVLKLGDGETMSETPWKFYGNSPTWTGTTYVLSGNVVEIANGVANPLGAYSEINKDKAYATVSLYDGATLKLPARAVGFDGLPQSGEIKMGRLTTWSHNNVQDQDYAVVDVGAEQSLIVENGVSVDSSVGLKKRGAGDLVLVANGTEKITTTENGEINIETDYVSFDLGHLDVAAGTFRIEDGTADVEDVALTASTIRLGKDVTFDVDTTETFELTGAEGDVVFTAEDGSTINIYVDAEGGTRFVAQEFNTYMNVGDTLLDVTSYVKPSLAPKTLVVFSTQDKGQINYQIEDIDVDDDLLGKDYIVDPILSTADSVVLSLVDSTKFSDIALNGNSKAVAKSLDNLIEKENYTPEEFVILSLLEDSIGTLTLATATGEVYASTIGFSYMNNLTMTQTLFDHLRNNALVAYSGASAVDPMDYGSNRSGASAPAGNYPVTSGYSPNGSFDQGPLYYNTDTNSYGPSVVPIAQPQQQGATTTGIYNGETYGGSSDGSGTYNIGWNRQRSELATMRGQAANYGDPGTLIYSAWFNAFGSANDARVHKNYFGYDAKQFGFLAGLDLFGSCDCRFGAYYGYQRNELKKHELNKYIMLGKVKTNEHTVGLYHQFGDETVYNIGTIRAGYGRFKTTRDVIMVGDPVPVSSKYDMWNAGVTFERGANFNAEPFVFSPYAQLDYNYYLRRKFSESSLKNNIYALKIGKSDYHSLRGQIGGRIALDMYPGSQHIRIVGSAAYIHEFLNAMYGKTWAAFQGFPSADGFVIHGNSLGRDWCALGLGLDWTPIPALNLFLKGNYLFNKYTRTPFTSAGLKFRW